MVYDESQNNEELKWANFTFNIYFNHYVECRNDLIYSAALQLLKSKNKFDESKGSFSTFAVKVCKNAMLAYLKKESVFSNNNENLSLDYEYEGCSFADLLEDVDSLNFEDKLNSEYNLNIIKQVFFECMTEMKVSKNNKFTKGILNNIILGYNDFQIAKKIGCTRELSRHVRKKFLPIFAEKLKLFDF